jgi:hypothetical protein
MWEDQQKMDAIRKAYQRAVQIPLDNVERLWQEMEAFETNLNKITVSILHAFPLFLGSMFLLLG